MIKPGTFDRKVSFCSLVTTKSAMGAATKAYTHSFYEWMSREPAVSGGEQYIDKRLVLATRHTYKGHYNSAINESMQLIDGTIKYNVISVNPIERNMFIEVMVERITE